MEGLSNRSVLQHCGGDCREIPSCLLDPWQSPLLHPSIGCFPSAPLSNSRTRCVISLLLYCWQRSKRHAHNMFFRSWSQTNLIYIQIQCVGHHSAKWKVAGSIPGQSTCLDCEFGPWSRAEETDQCFSLTLMIPCLSSSPPPSLIVVNKTDVVPLLMTWCRQTDHLL